MGETLCSADGKASLVPVFDRADSGLAGVEKGFSKKLEGISFSNKAPIPVAQDNEVKGVAKTSQSLSSVSYRISLILVESRPNRSTKLGPPLVEDKPPFIPFGVRRWWSETSA